MLDDPSNNQLKDWAYNPSKFIGVMQDFELTIAFLHRSDIILECASDNQCPKQLFFIRCAYLIVGNSVRQPYSNDSENEVLGFIRRAEKTGNAHLLEFTWRARELIENPSTFVYEEWCGGELAYEFFDA